VNDAEPVDSALDAWRAQVRAWLATVLPRRSQNERVWGEGDPDLAVFRSLPHDQEVALLDRVRAYRRARFDAGYGALTLPQEYGGAGLPSVYSVAFGEEEHGFDVPISTEIISVTTGLVGSAVSVFGTPEQREQFARAFQRTDLLCCQMFSEPGAGSDLAGLATRAVRDGDEWVVDGQKIWTSQAQFADYGFLLARTDPDVVKQAGITAFLVPMDTAGLEVRPIRQMSGPASFNEVFLTEVRIPDALRVGAPGEGWKVANATLGFERSSSGSGHRRKGGTVDDLLALARQVGAMSDPVARQHLADLLVRSTLQSATVERVARAAAAGARPGAAASLGKLISSDNLVRIGDLATELLGARIAADTGEWGTFAWTEHVLGAPGYRLAGGTDEIQRNIIAERVLGLPAEHRTDRAPFSSLPKA
jgi:alkylation response protein AidB-like acyl-CoA dehydrogenase